MSRTYHPIEERELSEYVAVAENWLEQHGFTHDVHHFHRAILSLRDAREQLREMRINDKCSCRGAPCARCSVTIKEADDVIRCADVAR